ncbi:hypothetical protein [Aeromicrobium sp.]|uniref:FMN-binding protein n=1 Tax=Aeromicrobium sp. TaxID=1871063 RepID=UPI0030C41D35
MKLPAHKRMLSAAAAASVLLLTAACGGGDSDGGSAAPTSSDSASADGGVSSESGSYEDGDYSGEGSYDNPGGNSSVSVELTLAGGEISDLTVTPEATNGTSKQYQTQFAGGITDQVVGKSIDDLDVSKIAGSSLTSQGFNQAIDDIKAEAQA